jgi:hypothetical protein
MPADLNKATSYEIIFKRDELTVHQVFRAVSPATLAMVPLKLPILDPSDYSLRLYLMSTDGGIRSLVL